MRNRLDIVHRSMAGRRVAFDQKVQVFSLKVHLVDVDIKL